MYSEDLESEELLISESVGLAFHSFDFVVRAFQGGCGNGMVVVGEDSHGVKTKGFGEVGGRKGDITDFGEMENQ
jgi:hypothetical protein